MLGCEQIVLEQCKFHQWKIHPGPAVFLNISQMLSLQIKKLSIYTLIYVVSNTVWYLQTMEMILIQPEA